MITHGELAAAIGKLEAAIVVDKDAKSQRDSVHHHRDHHDQDLPVGLAQRAYPFLDMMRLAQQKDADIVWGV